MGDIVWIGASGRILVWPRIKAVEQGQAAVRLILSRTKSRCRRNLVVKLPHREGRECVDSWEENLILKRPSRVARLVCTSGAC